MARAWLVTSRGIAKKIKQTAQFSSKQINELSAEAKRECPNCNYLIDNSDVNIVWPGLPAGVKFDPSDLELINHLESKVGIGNSKPHIFIDEFIPTLKEEEGICYTHPENLPGVNKDGHCSHFFHKISNAYSSGPRKRRKIDTEDTNSTCVAHVRWHKTGKTKPIIDNGIQKGWKKIMVLYKSAQRGCKPEKANWVMHQYHLGAEEEEKDGEIVVSKIFYQLRKEKEKSESESVENEDDNTGVNTTSVGPRTPMTNVPQAPCQKKSNQVVLAVQNAETVNDQHREKQTSPVVCLKNDGSSVWWENEPQADEEFNQQLLCNKVPGPFLLEPSLDLGLDTLMDEYLCSPPDLQISELPFGSQDSMSSWWQNHA